MELLFLFHACLNFMPSWHCHPFRLLPSISTIKSVKWHLKRWFCPWCSMRQNSFKDQSSNILVYSVMVLLGIVHIDAKMLFYRIRGTSFSSKILVHSSYISYLDFNYKMRQNFPCILMTYLPYNIHIYIMHHIPSAMNMRRKTSSFASNFFLITLKGPKGLRITSTRTPN